MAVDRPEENGRWGPENMDELFYGSATLGERGQIVIPAEARKHHDLAPGDKLLVFRHPHLHGMVLARLDDLQALLEELRQWVEVATEVQRGHALRAGRAERRRSGKGGQGR